MIGRRLQQYLIVDKAGEGGMGVVWKARDTRLDRDVALKVLPSDRFDDAIRRERFTREAKSASALNHPNIITIYEIDSEAGVDFIAMEYVRGETLAERLQRGPLEISSAIAYATQIADALACAHQAGIIHRDLKPGNIMIGAAGAVKVLDFGLAKADDTRSSTDIAESPTMAPLTLAGTALGTPAYMSPEQALGDAVDARSDVFAFGIVLYEMFTGKLPFAGSTRSEALHRLHFGEPLAMTSLRPDVPPGLPAIVAKTLAKKPEDRYASMIEVREALADIHRVPAGLKASLKADLKTRLSRGKLAVVIMLIAAAIGVGVYRDRVAAPAPTIPDPPESALPQTAYDLSQRAARLLERPDRTGNVDAAIGLLEEAIKRDDRHALAHAYLSEAYRRKQTTNPDPQWVRLAAEGARRALELNSDLALAHVSQGFVDFDAGRYADAEARFARAAELDPLSPQPHVGLALCYMTQKRDAEAEGAFRRAIERKGTDWRPDSELAAFRYRRSRYEEAAASWEASRARAPDNVTVLKNLGAAYHQLGRYDDAAAVLQRALEITPTAATYANLGTTRFYQGRYADAVPAFENAVELGANNYLYWHNLADAYRWAPGRRAESIPAYSRAIALVNEQLAKNPKDDELRTRLALYLVKSGNRPGALDAIRQLEPSPNLSGQALMRLTVVHELARNRDRALEFVERALKAGYPLTEISNEPELTALRADARYHRVVAAIPTR